MVSTRPRYIALHCHDNMAILSEQCCLDSHYLTIMVLCASRLFSVVTMTTDKANNGQKKQVCEQQQEDGEAGVQEPDPIEPHQDGPSSSPLTPGGSEEGQQPKLRQHTPGGRGLSRLFSSFLKRRSQCSDDEGAKVERGQEKESHLDPKAPIADPEPELRNEGDAALDLHSISSSENQVRERKNDGGAVNPCEITGLPDFLTDHPH